MDSHTKVNFCKNETTDGHRWTQMNYLCPSVSILGYKYSIQAFVRSLFI